MKIIENYQVLPIGKLQNLRLYIQGRPLSMLLRKEKKNIPYEIPDYVKLIDNELTGNYISLDCSGWYFENSIRKCTAIEISQESLRYRNDIIFEYDYDVWRPTYLNSDPVLAYFSTYFKYSSLDNFIQFCNIWGVLHSKLIIGLDPSKIKFNYLKYNLLDELSIKLELKHSIRILKNVPFELLFIISNENFKTS
jgi:hypothetical protein